MATIITFFLVAVRSILETVTCSYRRRLCLFQQTSLGIYLKLHIHEGSKIRLYAVRVHGVIGRAWPLVGWIRE